MKKKLILLLLLSNDGKKSRFQINLQKKWIYFKVYYNISIKNCVVQIFPFVYSGPNPSSLLQQVGTYNPAPQNSPPFPYTSCWLACSWLALQKHEQHASRYATQLLANQQFSVCLSVCLSAKTQPKYEAEVKNPLGPDHPAELLSEQPAWQSIYQQLSCSSSAPTFS